MVGGETGEGKEEDLRAELERHDDADGSGVVMGELGEDDPVLRGALHQVPMLETSAPPAQTR